MQGPGRPGVAWRRAMAALTAGVVALAAPPVAIAQPAREAAAADPDVVLALATLDGARVAVAAGMVRSARAEAARRDAETVVVEAHRTLEAAVRDGAHVEAALRAASSARADARRAQAAAQEHFDLSVATSYKFGGAVSSSLLLTALRSASDAHDLARAVDQLDRVLGHSYGELGRRTRAAEIATERVESLTRLREVARTAIADAAAQIAPAEESAHRARTAAHASERALLASTAAALDAEEEALSIGAEVAMLAGDDPLAPGTAMTEPEGPDLEQRRAWLEARHAALVGAAALPPSAWVARPGLTCPVLGGTFGNDFHQPRSHGRRHVGTDVFAPMGTPVVALAPGTVTSVDHVDAFDGDGDLGGITVSWETEVGRFFAAHLDSVAPGLEVGDRVQAGEVVGRVGDTGNAAGGAPHLHLGWSVDGVEINPWPTLALVCRAEQGEPA